LGNSTRPHTSGAADVTRTINRCYALEQAAVASLARLVEPIAQSASTASLIPISDWPPLRSKAEQLVASDSSCLRMVRSEKLNGKAACAQTATVRALNGSLRGARLMRTGATTGSGGGNLSTALQKLINGLTLVGNAPLNLALSAQVLGGTRT